MDVVSLMIMTLFYQVRTLKKVQSVLADPNHLLSREGKLLPSGSRYSLFIFRTNRFRKAFVAAIGLLNNA